MLSKRTLLRTSCKSRISTSTGGFPSNHVIIRDRISATAFLIRHLK
jgi:hypothetical protein